MSDSWQDTARAIVNVFETGRVRGDYSAVAVLKGDRGHLSYGRSQASLGSGALFGLLDIYCQQPNARFATQLRPYLFRFQTRDVTLDYESQVRQLLTDAGSDPVMQATQNQFFDRLYMAPACSAADQLGIPEPLTRTVIYDSYIQGGWATVRRRVADPVAGKTQEWVLSYIAARTQWLKSLAPPLPSTVYRMDAFNALIAAKNWNLQLPIVVHGVTVSVETIAGDTPDPGAGPRVLRLTTPYLRGTDVAALQLALKAQNLPAVADEIYGPFTAQLVAGWQKTKAISEDGVGPKTRLSLGL